MTPAGARLVHLVRHGEAVTRLGWQGPDGLRPLTDDGRRQADAIARRLVPEGEPVVLARALSSPAVRCTDTLRPAAALVGIEVETTDALLEGADPRAALDELLAASVVLADGHAIVACTHGDVVDGVIARVAGSGAPVDGPPSSPKAATWELAVLTGGLDGARYVGPPVLQP